MSALIDFGAEFSDDGMYRYRLWRRWGHGPMLMVIGLNPSTADATTDDPTVRRCRGFARDWGFAGLRMLNLFAFRATDPRAMLAAADPVGPDNFRHIVCDASVTAVHEGGAILVAWGAHGRHRAQSQAINWALDREKIGYACLGLTKDGEPKHPLYLPRDARPVAFNRDGGRLVTGPLPIAATREGGVMTNAVDTRAWQPWTPTVGDRVVCRPSPECRAWCAPSVGDGWRYGHHRREDGRVGTVVVTPPAGDGHGHAITVGFDAPYLDEEWGVRMVGAVYAACELEALEADR